jgi:hypothetical protein
MARTPNKSDAKGGAGVIRLYPHKSTERAIAKAQERLDKGQLSKRGHRLTGKQEIFSQRIVDGLTQADAIRAAYDVMRWSHIVGQFCSDVRAVHRRDRTRKITREWCDTVKLG